MQGATRGVLVRAAQRPDKRNALSQALLEALAGVCAEVETDPQARGVVLCGRALLRRRDFGEFEQLLQADKGTVPIAEHNREFGRVLERLMALPVPTLASCAARRWAAAADSRRPSTA